MIESNGTQVTKVLSGNREIEQLTIAAWSPRRPYENVLRYV
jgi:hypothetical protein